MSVSVDSADLRIDICATAGGPGAKNSCSVRVTHVPTGIVAECHDEGGRHANQVAAMERLHAALAGEVLP